MAQRLRIDKIGALSHSGGNITMAASASNPAYLTIGGQQYRITSSLSVAVGTATAVTRYQIYATVSAGVVSLQKSTAENSIGPGTSSWKLIGSFYAGETNTFGAFINITGAPRATGITVTNSTTFGVGFGSVVSKEVFMDVDGLNMKLYGWFESGTLAANEAVIVFPGSLAMANKYQTAHHRFGTWNRITGGGASNWWAQGDAGALTFITGSGLDRFRFVLNAAGDSYVGGDGNTLGLASGDTLGFSAEVEISSFSNTPISER